jgi:hypothetical protein
MAETKITVDLESMIYVSLEVHMEQSQPHNNDDTQHRNRIGIQLMRDPASSASRVSKLKREPREQDTAAGKSRVRGIRIDIIQLAIEKVGNTERKPSVASGKLVTQSHVGYPKPAISVKAGRRRVNPAVPALNHVRGS